VEVHPSPPETAGIAAALVQDMLDNRRRAKQEREMRAVLHVDSGAPAEWPFAIEVGTVAASVVHEAHRIDAKLIVMGLNQHGAIGRAIGNDTVREVTAVSGIPVLAVRPQLTSLPKHVVVAVDFSRASIRAAHLARCLLEEHGSMQLLFVESMLLGDSSERTEGMRLIHTKGVQGAFEQLVKELEPDAGMTIETVIRWGNPLEEITRFCVEEEPDLVAIGSQSHRFLDRLLLGSVARSVAGDGRWSVLVTPSMRAERA
jgi:nucleotide-binding universal stress UspA family protein